MTFRRMALAGVVLTLVGCSATSGARLQQAASQQPQLAIAQSTATPQVDEVSLSVQPVSPVQPLPKADGCEGHATIVDMIYLPPAKVIARSTNAFTGVIEEIGDAQWNTVDSAPPTSSVDYNARHVFRLIRLKVATVVKGDASGEIVMAVEGGKIGCNSFLSDPGRLDLASGQTYFWLTGSDALRAKVTAVPVVAAIWNVGPDGNVAVPMSGDGHLEVMPVDEALKITN
jgi:hypothetical protein